MEDASVDFYETPRPFTERSSLISSSENNSSPNPNSCFLTQLKGLSL